jgi:hypothetical protein
VTPKQAVEIIRTCIKAGRYHRFAHFDERMDERGLFRPDVLAVVNAPDRVRADGRDDYGRNRWLIRGRTTDGLRIELETRRNP